MFLLLAAAYVVPAAYYLLIGAVDGNPPVEVQALVSSKGVNDDREDDSYVPVLSLSWKQQRIEGGADVRPEMFSGAEPGDSVRVLLHPGAFSRRR
jgi:hypothetical protein